MVSAIIFLRIIKDIRVKSASEVFAELRKRKSN